MSKKIVIVGGVAGGASAAARLRRLDETAEIVLFERDEHISFANCGLPYYIGDVIEDRSKLLVQTVAGMSARFNMDIRNFSDVTQINRDAKTVSIKNVITNETYEESYDTLVLSPGAQPIAPPIPGLEDSKSIFTLRNIPNTDQIKSYVDKNKPTHVSVIGGGFIGLEMAENFSELGMKVTLIEMAHQVMAPLDYEMAAIVHNHLREKDVELILNDGVKSFENEGTVINLSSGEKVNTDMIIMSIGVKPENKLAADADLDLGDRGGIKVNEFLQTKDESIYAIGDAIEIVDYINGKPAMIPLAGPANRQGRIVANNIYGKNEKYKGTLGTSVAKVYDLTVAATGNNEKSLTQQGKEFDVLHIHPMSHAGYYPNASPISLKVTFNKETGTIFGAQAVGLSGVEKRIDVIATAIMGNLSVFELADLELSYAPPYSSAKDPVNMAGYVASNMNEGRVETVQWHEIDDIIKDDGVLLDVRGPNGFSKGAIEGSIHIPLNDLRDRMKELPKDKTIHVSCRTGLDAYVATRILNESGYISKNLDGAWLTYGAVSTDKASQIKVTN